MADTQQQPLAVGTRIGVYEIKGIKSTDRFGITYRAWNQHLNAQMAVKEYFPRDFAVRRKDGCTLEPQSERDQAIYSLGMNRFLEQAENLMRIDHPNLVRIQNGLQKNGTAYVVMEIEDGVPLENMCDRSDLRLGDEELRVIFLPILEALKQTHDKGLIHGDINPSNILLRHDGESVLLNFAADRLAISANRDMLETTLTKSCAPAEQYAPDNHPGPWTDLYALGATMYRCVTGMATVASLDRTAATQKGTPDPQKPAIEAAHAGYSENLLSAIDWMMNLNIQDRPQSVADVLAALKREGDDDVHADQEQQDEPRRARLPFLSPGRRSTQLIGTGLVVAVLIALGFWYLPGSEQNPQQNELKQRELADSTTGQRGTTVVAKAELDTTPEPDQSDHTAPIVPSPSPAKPQPDTSTGKGSEAIEIASEGTPEGDQGAELASDPAETVTATEIPAAQAKIEQDVSESTPSRTTIPDVPAPLTEPAVISQESTQDTSGEFPEERTAETAPDLAAIPESAAFEAGQPDPDSSTVSHATRPQTQAPSKETVQEAIEQHMTAAEKDLVALRLTTPQGENALEHYQAVLNLEPEHPGAHKGLEMIVDRYVWLIGKAIDKGSLQRARIYLERAEGISPEAPGLHRRRAELNAAESTRSIN